jgi:hypothetical protein
VFHPRIPVAVTAVLQLAEVFVDVVFEAFHGNLIVDARVAWGGDLGLG